MVQGKAVCCFVVDVGVVPRYVSWQDLDSCPTSGQTTPSMRPRPTAVPKNTVTVLHMPCSNHGIPDCQRFMLLSRHNLRLSDNGIMLFNA